MKKRVLMISPIPSHPQTAGNRARILALGQSIKRLGHEFYFAHAEREMGDRDAMGKYWGNDFFFPLAFTRRNPLPLRIKRKLRSLFDKEAYLKHDLDAWYDNAVDEQLIKLYQKFRFDVVIVEYIFFSKALLCFRDTVLKVIDTHDVFTNRHRIFTDKNIEYSWYSTTATQEKKGLDRADVIIAIQDSERAFFEGLTNKTTITVGHMVKTIPQESGKPSQGKILFIGSANKSNIDAVNFFIKDVFPKIQMDVPNTTLYVAGKVCHALNGCAADIVALGEITDLGATYNMVDVVINPIRMGTGLKIKNIEALGYSKPLVTTTIGATGLESGFPSALSIADTAEAFSEAVIKILRNPALYKSLSENGYNLAVNWNQQQIDALQSVINRTSSF